MYSRYVHRLVNRGARAVHNRRAKPSPFPSPPRRSAFRSPSIGSHFPTTLPHDYTSIAGVHMYVRTLSRYQHFP